MKERMRERERLKETDTKTETKMRKIKREKESLGWMIIKREKANDFYGLWLAAYVSIKNDPLHSHQSKLDDYS